MKERRKSQIAIKKGVYHQTASFFFYPFLAFLSVIMSFFGIGPQDMTKFDPLKSCASYKDRISSQVVVVVVVPFCRLHEVL